MMRASKQDLFRGTGFLRPGRPGFSNTVVTWRILQLGLPGLGMTVPFWLVSIQIRRNPE